VDVPVVGMDVVELEDVGHTLSPCFPR